MRPFWRAAAEGRLLIQCCASCGTKYFPAIDLCKTCLADGLDWIESSGRGEVYSYVVMHHVYHPAFADRVPYVVVDVRLAEGPHMTSQLVNAGADEIRIGRQVEVCFERRSEEVTLPYFRPL
jgi:uncharacterized OB-fold protein